MPNRYRGAGYGAYGGGYNPYQSNTNSGSLLNFSVNEPTYIGRPVEAIGGMMGALDQRNQAVLDQASAVDIAMSNVDVAEADYGYLEEQRQAFQQGIQDIIDSENYSMSGALTNKLYRDFVGNRGLKTAMDNKVKFDEDQAKMLDRYYEGDISGKAYDFYANKPFEGTQEIAPGQYSRYQPKKIAKVFDYETDLRTYGTTFKAGQIDKPLARLSDPETDEFIGYSVERTTGKDTKEMHDQMVAKIKNDPDAYAYAEQIAEIDGIPVKEVIEGMVAPHVAAEEAKKIENRNTIFSPNARQTKSTGRDPNEIYTWERSRMAELPYETPLHAAAKDMGRSKWAAAFWDNHTIYNDWVTGGMRDDDKGVMVKTFDANYGNMEPGGKNTLDSFVETYINRGISDKMGRKFNELNADEKVLAIEKFNKFNDQFGKIKPIHPEIQDYTVDYGKERTHKYFGTTGLISRNTKDDQYPIAGGLNSASVYIPATGEYLTGKEFQDKINSGEFDDEEFKLLDQYKININARGRLDETNEFTMVTNDNAFVDGEVFNINGVDVVIANTMGGKSRQKKVINNKLHQAELNVNEMIPIDGGLFVKNVPGEGFYVFSQDDPNPLGEAVTDREQLASRISNAIDKAK